MQLSLSLPARWILKQGPNQQFAAILPASHATPGALPDAIITYGPIVLKPDEPRSWQDRMSGTDAPPGSSIRYGNTIDRLTVAGWPLLPVRDETPHRSSSSPPLGPLIMRIMMTNCPRQKMKKTSLCPSMR